MYWSIGDLECYVSFVLEKSVNHFTYIHSFLDSFPRWVITEYGVEFSVLYSKLLLVTCFKYACVQSHFCHVWLCNTMNCSLPGSSALGILQARILVWVAMPFSRGSSWLRNWTHIPMSPVLAGKLFTTNAICRVVYICQSPSPSLSLPHISLGNQKFVFYICDSISVL